MLHSIFRLAGLFSFCFLLEAQHAGSTAGKTCHPGLYQRWSKTRMANVAIPRHVSQLEGNTTPTLPESPLPTRPSAVAVFRYKNTSAWCDRAPAYAESWRAGHSPNAAPPQPGIRNRRWLRSLALL